MTEILSQTYHHGSGIKKKPVAQSKKPTYHPGVVAGLVSGALASGVLIFAACRNAPVPIPLYTVTRVIDGDTFETSEKQYIRLSGIDAPEAGRCGSAEAKQFLEKLILGKPVYIKILYHLGSRLTGLAYTASGSVNTAMLSSGWAVKYDRDAPNDPAMQRASDEARQKKRGVFSPRCTQKANPENAGCNIKGNNPDRNGTKTYHLPACPHYGQTAVELYKGDQWFCTEGDAQRDGYVKAAGCTDR